ncbi:MAG: hypothetical protein DMG72_04630, partial [Acidobacteria bacterium]
SWPVQVPDGPALFSLRPENIRLAGISNDPIGDAVRFRGKLRHHAFHGASELLQIEHADGLVLWVRIRSSGGGWHGDLEFEFSPNDAVPVRESQTRD